MNYSGLYHFDVLNGLGFRTSLFVSGCDKQPKCRDCQNPKAWCHGFGEIFTQATQQEVIQSLAHPAIRGLSLLGGEPSDNLADGALFTLLEAVRRELPDKDIWAWSGYTWEVLQQDPLKRRFVAYLDVLIDGEFIPERKDLNRPFGNSDNQRVIDVQKSLTAGQVILLPLADR